MPPADSVNPGRGPGGGATLRGAAGAAVRAGLLGGLLWGLGDGVVAGLHAGTSGAATWAGCLAASGLLHALVATLLLVPLVPLLAALARRGADPLVWALALVLGLALFLDLYWWSRPYVLWGVPATDPRRLAAAAAMLLGGLAVGALAARALASLARGRVLPWVLAAVALAGGGYLAATRPGASDRGAITERNRDMPNVLLFVVDALRSDVLGCYGNTRVKTPRMDALAARGVVFEQAFVQAPYTWTSFGSILTGKYPRRHGLLKMAPGVRMPENVTLASHLKEQAGYTGATLMTGTLTNGSGLLRGFDAYYEAMVGHPLVQTDQPWSVFKSELVLARVWTKLEHRVDDAPVATKAVEWLRRNGQRRFVAMVHYYSTHTPYDPPARYREMYLDPDYDGPIQAFYAGYREKIEAGEYEPTEADVEQIRNLYNAGVTWADDMIGEVLDELERQGVLDDTLVIVTSDHGEELNDHPGYWEHNFMWQTNLRVPLLMSWPRGLRQGVRVPAIVETVDILPTVCDLAGLSVPDDTSLPDDAGKVDGVSLLPLVDGVVERVKEFSFAENGHYLSIQDRAWKLVVPEDALEQAGWETMLGGEGEPAQLYHLADDPDEYRSVLEEHPEQAERLVKALRAWSASMPRGREVIVESVRDRELSDRLRELGYLDGIGHGMEEDGHGGTHGPGDRQADPE